MALWDGLVARYCPSLDTSGNGTTTLYNLDGDGNQIGSNNGTLTNMDAANWVLSDSKYSLDFSSGDFVQCPVDLGFIQNAHVFTYATWIRRDSTGRDFFGRTASGSAEKGFFTGVENFPGFGINAFRFFISNGTSSAVREYRTADNSVANSTWVHLAITATISNVLMYINGVSATVSTHHLGSWTNPSGSSSRPLSLGYFMNGNLDDTCIFNVAKSASDIALLASQRGYLLPAYTPPLINGGLINQSRINGGLAR